ncbi:MAG TPA: GNAT family N-acetyltransferase [Casimicrobiaceae bacterium]|nr:GNAT family N-acetyltransferase [Casimicrobiaceae bacterium]
MFASPKRGTFGGLGLNCPLNPHTVEHFLRMLIDYLKAIGAREIDVKCAPFSHDLPLSSLVSNILLRQGGAIASHELNHDMQIDARPFVQRIDYGNAKRIRKCLREGFVAEQIDPSTCEAAYRVVRDNRERRGYPVSMTAEQIKAMVKTFPGRLHFFAVYPDSQKSRIVAAGICIAVSRYILYVFYWGDAADMGPYSPIALLASCIYEFCQQEGFQLLDAGTSTLAGEPNHGLINFKRNLGFSESLKLSFACRV